jgi:hypothetical protein
MLARPPSSTCSPRPALQLLQTEGGRTSLEPILWRCYAVTKKGCFALSRLCHSKNLVNFFTPVTPEAIKKFKKQM